MDQSEFRQVVNEYLLPMLQARLNPDQAASSNRESLTSYVTPNQLAVKPRRDAGYRLTLTRDQSFTTDERDLVGHFIDELATVAALNAGSYLNDLLQAIPRKVVARHLDVDGPLLSVLQRLEAWSSQTYEGRRIVACIGIDTVPAGTRIPLDELWEESFGPVLTNGFDTLLVVGSDSEIASMVQLSSSNLSSTAPYRLREVAGWADDGRTSIVLNLQGEILVFQKKSLRFARRSGRWQHYVHETNINRMFPPRNRELREAIYESCLDVSFARTGGCIGVVQKAHAGTLNTVVSPADLLNGEDNYKTRFLSKIIGNRFFQNLDRRARAELLSIDGALIMDHNGLILAAGAIIQLPSGSVGGGGRTAAARKLSGMGLGVKVSQDGSITGFRNGDAVFKS